MTQKVMFQGRAAALQLMVRSLLQCGHLHGNMHQCGTLLRLRACTSQWAMILAWETL